MRSLPAILVGAIFAGGCERVAEPHFDDGEAPPAPDEWTGPVADGGFGSRLAASGDRVWAGSPFAARVDELLPAGAVGNSVTGASGSFFGSGLAVVGGLLAIGVPVRGEVLIDGAVVATLPGMGGVIAADGDRWVASTPTGWRSVDGAMGNLGRRPSALAWSGDEVLAGAAHGQTALWSGSAAIATPRVAPTDEQGFALAVCPDDTGAARVWSGAPGAGVIVPAGGASLGPGSDRFGAAMACGSDPGVLWVGAPAHDAHAGALYRVEGGEAVRVLTGAAGEELGAALIVSGGRVFVGAPGYQQGRGRVLARPESSFAR